MQKRIIGAVIVFALIAAFFFIVNHTRLFKESPNIIVIMTDDLDWQLMPYLPKTNELIGDQGATFTNFIITTPLCCPSRASILRGQYAHNTEILENAPGFVLFFRLDGEADTLPVWLNKAGYETSLAGKYLNNYPFNAGRNYVPPGWTDWHAFIYEKGAAHFYYDYAMNENGELVEYGSQPQDYSTDVIRSRAVDFIHQSRAKGSPFFLFVSVYAPHGPFIPAPRHAGMYDDLTYPQTPSFNEQDLSDKPSVIQALTMTGDEFDENDANAFFRRRAGTLPAVDEMVEEIIRLLEQTDELDNTYIFFLSDNGYRTGQHGIPSGKGTAYEEDIRVPLLVRGPGIQPNIRIDHLVANIDLAPTIADMAGVPPSRSVDGRSFLPLLEQRDMAWRKVLLIELGYDFVMQASAGARAISFSSEGLDPWVLTDPENDNLLVDAMDGNYRGIRGERFVYIEYANGEMEFYDLENDPYQLDNSAGQLSAETLGLLRGHLADMLLCSGRECRALENTLEIEIK